MASDPLLGRTLLGRYRVLRALGAGAHGKVFLAEDLARGSERVALKLVEGLVGGGDDEPGQETLRWFRHPNWADILDGGRYGEYDWFQATRFVDGPSLDRLEGPQPVEWVWRFLEDGARVLRALHRRGLLHYDVTPGNWLAEGPPAAPRFVLTDGGLAHEGSVSGFARGTPLYMAPEVTEDRHHDQRVDLYSLGLVAYRLATGTEPLAGGAGDVLGRRRREPAPHPRERRPDLPEALDALITGLLAPDPNARTPDADSLLKAIAQHRPEIVLVTAAEAVAAATGGALVGRDAAVDRFASSVRALAQHLPPGSSQGPHAGKPHEPVLLLRGASGSGATRLVNELAARARREEVPFLLLAGREGAADRRNPLRPLAEGLAALGQALDAPVEPVMLAERRDGDSDPDARAHREVRIIERFLDVAERSARRSPFVLLVEDFPELPHLAQEAVRVLARHLLGRSERATSTAPLPLMLVVDLGTEPADQLTNPDAHEPDRSVVQLEPFTPEQAAALCAERFPGLSLAPEDAGALTRLSDGQPATIAALLGEAYRRGDLQHDTGSWVWSLEQAASYRLPRGLTPTLLQALRDAGGPLRALLEQLALLESVAPAAVVHALWLRLGTGEIPPTPLLSLREHAESVVYALPTHALRRLLIQETPAEKRVAHLLTLRSALEEHPNPHTTIDRIALRVEAGDVLEALQLAHAVTLGLSLEQRHALQPLLRRIVERQPVVLADERARAAIANLLDRGPDALVVARALASMIPIDGKELPALLLTARVIEETQDFPFVRTLLESHAAVRSADLAALAELHVTLSRVTFALRQPADALLPLNTAKRLIKSIGRSKRDHPRLLVQYLKTRAQAHAVQSRPARAARTLTLARHVAGSLHQPVLMSEILNNLGIVRASQDLPAQAAILFERALRLKRFVGDVAGTARSIIHLAKLYRLLGEEARAARYLYEAIGTSRRHGALTSLLIAHLDIGAVLDRQRSTTAAIDHYRSGLTVALRGNALHHAAMACSKLAPLAAAAGDTTSLRISRAAMARVARLRAGQDARHLAYLTATTWRLHAGRSRSAGRALPHVSAHAAQAYRDSQTLRELLRFILDLQISPRASIPAPVVRAGRRERGTRAALRMAAAVSRAIRMSKANKPTAAYLRSVLSRARVSDGVARRLSIEIALASAQHLSAESAAGLLAEADTIMADTSEHVLRARGLALRSLYPTETGAWQTAQCFSESVAALDVVSDGRAVPLPDEHVRAMRRHGALSTLLTDSADETPTLQAAHAFAHRLLHQSGGQRPQDPRLSVALRHVLEATARMPAGASLADLLQAMTRQATEITGAQRACVVLLDGVQSGKLRIATSTASSGRHLKDHEISHTVLNRVMASRKPLLLHDVFGDADLMIRPSVTSLALRSILCVPLCRRDQLFGVMYADSANTAASFDSVDLEVLSLFAEQAAGAIELNRMVSNLQGAYADLKSMQDRLVRSERLRVIGELSSGVAHEFNNLLTAILARVQLMGLGYHDAETQRSLRLIEKATMDAAGVVRRLQSFSKEQRTGTFTAVPIAEICTDAVELLRPLWSSRRRHGRPIIAVRSQLEQGMVVRGNATELREVVTNLLKNALDALSETGGVIMVSVGRSDGQVRLRVRDDGPGIPADVLPKIFDPFFTTKGEKGTGLGLCLSQQIAERHGGELLIESAPGEGTSATVLLPLSTGPLSPETVEGSPGTLSPDQRGLRILIVDDDADVLRPLCTFLERCGYAVAAAGDGAQALLSIQDRVPDVLLSDIGMPHMDGIELCQRARARWPEMPVVLMSGWTSEIDAARARALGARALLAKPFAMQQVTDLLSAIARK